MALIDAAAGIYWEGEEPPQASLDDALASRAYAMLANGMGGIDWSGLALAVELLGVGDVEALVQRLVIIKSHKPEKPGG